MHSATTNGSAAQKPVDKWHVLLAHPREERMAAARLVGHGIEVYLPELPSRCRAGRKMQQRLVPMLPTYLFMRVRLAIPWQRIRATPGIRFGTGGHCALMSNGAYGVVAGRAMEIIRAREARLCDRPDERPDAPTVGKGAEVVDGPFAWLKGVIENVDRLDTHGRINLALEIFGRVVSTEFDVSQIRVV